MDIWIQAMFSGAGVAAVVVLFSRFAHRRKERTTSLNAVYRDCAACPLPVQDKALENMTGLTTHGIASVDEARWNTTSQQLTIVSTLGGSNVKVTCVVDRPLPNLLLLRAGKTIRFEGTINEISARSVLIVPAGVTLRRFL